MIFLTRSRKDNSSVEDNYEWDSELAAESEILEALKHFENLKSSASMSEVLLALLLWFDQYKTNCNKTGVKNSFKKICFRIRSVS